MIVRRDPASVRLLTRNGYDWTARFPLIAEATGMLRARSSSSTARRLPAMTMASRLSIAFVTAAMTSGEWNDDNTTCLRMALSSAACSRQCRARRIAVDVDADIPASRTPHADPRLRAAARGRDGSVCQELAAGVKESPGVQVVPNKRTKP